MKFLSFLLLCLFPFVAFSRSSTTTHSNDVDEFLPVLDIDGEPLNIHEEYSIASIPLGGGSVYLANLGNTKCPNGVVQDSSGTFEYSTPVKFFTMLFGSHTVYENQDISIKFTPPILKLECVNETVWKVGPYRLGPLHPPPRFIVTGGTLGFPGPDTIDNWFKIEKYETGRPHSYILRYCPNQNMCPTCHFICADVGLTDDSEHARLALNNKPYPFGFSKLLNKNDA